MALDTDSTLWDYQTYYDPQAQWTAIRQVDTKNNPRRRIARHYAALLRISNGVRPFFISMRW